MSDLARVSLISFKELAEKIDTRKVAAVKAWCARNRVPWFPDSKGRPMTTSTALDRALFRGKDEENEIDWSPFPWQKSPLGRRKSNPST